MSKTIYIAGKVTGLPEETTKQKFSQVQQELEAQGHQVVNPMNLVESAPGLKQASWQMIMRACLTAMMCCDEVHMLPCWKDSKGARVERDTALGLDMPVVYR